MTPRQKSLYWREWSKVRGQVSDQHPGWTAAEWDVYRHEVHVQALGEDVSSADFTNEEFDKILGAFREISEDGAMEPQLRAMDQPRRRLIWKIRHSAPEAVQRSISVSKFGTDQLDQMKESQLKQLLFTLARWENHTRKRLVQPSTPVEVQAALAEDNAPF